MSSWIIADLTSVAECRLFCLPYAGTGASLYRGWDRLVPENIQVCPVQLPGREERLGEHCFSSMETLVPKLLEELVPYLDRPYILFGHSMGAKIAFELCRAIISNNYYIPELLVVSACRAPHIPEPKPIYNLPVDDFLEGLKRYSTDITLLKENHELLELILPFIRSDFLLDESYTFSNKEILNIPIQAFYGINDPEATFREVCEWGDYTNNFYLDAVHGSHLYIKNEKEYILNKIYLRLKSIIDI